MHEIGESKTSTESIVRRSGRKWRTGGMYKWTLSNSLKSCVCVCVGGGEAFTRHLHRLWASSQNINIE